jgi:hypothetical protein
MPEVLLKTDQKHWNVKTRPWNGWLKSLLHCHAGLRLTVALGMGLLFSIASTVQASRIISPVVRTAANSVEATTRPLASGSIATAMYFGGWRTPPQNRRENLPFEMISLKNWPANLMICPLMHIQKLQRTIFELTGASSTA